MNQIDQLVNEQLAGGEPCTGYDYGDPDFPRCPHPWCDEEWHGLPITTRMAEMRWRGRVDPGYRYPDDSSPVLCPGSDDAGTYSTADQSRALAELLRSMAAQPVRRRTHARPQWWCCFHAGDLDIVPAGFGEPGTLRRFIQVNGETIELEPDEDGACVLGRSDPGADRDEWQPQWMAIHCREAPRAGVWVAWRPTPPGEDYCD
ncbi:hypothetical protein [Nocardia sp. NPDC005978]|uniref:hypothetical protein n=1 Tax=unclassified Nocardia TaxID=2637762 RepID=UPI0033A75DD6